MKLNRFLQAKFFFTNSNIDWGPQGRMDGTGELKLGFMIQGSLSNNVFAETQGKSIVSISSIIDLFLP